MTRLPAHRLLVLGIVFTATVSLRTATSQKVDIAVQDRSNAYPSVAAAGSFAAIAWGATRTGGTIDIYAATSRDGGLTFGAPRRVNGDAEPANLSGEQPPRVTLIPRAGADPAIVVVWTSKSAAGTRLVSARSTDGGRSFTTAAPLPGSEAPGNRGWESIATGTGGSVVAIWLDHRELATGRSGTAMAHAEHQHRASGQDPADGVARAQLSKLFFARLGEPSNAIAVASGVCYCCKTSIATDTAGGVYAAWRHVYPGNVRDVAFTRSSDGGRTFAPPVRVSNDQWVIDGCPENGPAITVDERRRIHIVWPTLVPASTPAGEPTPTLFYAFSDDGQRFTARQRIPTEGVPRHPQLVIGPRNELLVAWDEQSGGTRRVAMARGTLNGTETIRFARQAIGDGTRGEYPVLARTGNDTLVAWTSGPVERTVLRVARLP